MAAARFEYIAPRTLYEAIEALVSGGNGTRIMAGGTDLLVKIRHRLLAPSTIVSLKGIAGLDDITYDRKQGLTIGAMALLAEVASHAAIRRHYPTIAAAADATANVQVRNMGTVVGNICNASPSADNAPTLMAMGATVHIVGPAGTRSLPLDQFFQGPGFTALATGEIVTAITVPPPLDGSGTAYHSLSQRGKLDCSAVGVGTQVVIHQKRCTDVRIVVGACAPVPMRTRAAEKLLVGKAMSEALIRKTAQVASEETAPITDVRASAPYRWKMVAVLVARALADARKMALGKQK